MNKVLNKPKLLSPAGSYDALCAAISAGADEVYFGASSFNARYSAKNFSDDELKEAIKLCRICGVNSNITVNTLLFDREINDALELIYNAACLGADAFIIQDMALARLVKAQMPSVEIHASTQCACHNKDGAKKLYDAGFKRIVLARELSAEDIKLISENAPYETEIFVHGALCVSHSGQCLFSQAVGGRSGNRGMCAQPCRMEYSLNGDCKKCYALSLKDLSLCRHITDIIPLGTASLKLEGRMKSPEYVYGVTKTFKTLLTEERNASDDEERALFELFSRNGFTDGYFTKKYLSTNSSMYGVRSEKEKALTRDAEGKMTIPRPKRGISAVCSFTCTSAPSLSLMCGDFVACVTGENIIEKAKNAPSDFESVAKNLIKTGDTHFSLDKSDIEMSIDDNAFVPAGVVNELRRKCTAQLEEMMTKPIGVMRSRIGFIPLHNTEKEADIALRLYFRSTESFFEKISGYKNVESVVFPPAAFEDSESIREICGKYKVGVLFPRVLFENEKEKAEVILKKIKELGAVFCEVSNIGHIDIARSAGLEVYGGIGLNITNSVSAQFYTDVLGLSSIVLSPEMKMGAVRDLAKRESISYCFYARGRLPLMVLESCILKANVKCKKCGGVCGTLTDRTDARFPVYSQKRFGEKESTALYSFPCRNVIYNSVIHDLRMKKELYTCGLNVLCVSVEDDGLPM